MKIVKRISTLLGFVLILSCNGNKEIEKTNESFQFDYGSEIEEIISKMSIEEKIGQMTQINIDVISKGEIFNLTEPHQLDEVKLDSAISHYYVGSILNVGGHTYTRGH